MDYFLLFTSSAVLTRFGHYTANIWMECLAWVGMGTGFDSKQHSGFYCRLSTAMTSSWSKRSETVICQQPKNSWSMSTSKPTNTQQCTCSLNTHVIASKMFWVIWWVTHNAADYICIFYWCFIHLCASCRGSRPFRYSHIVSEPLGRSTYKERYLFLYRYKQSNSF